MRPQVAVPNILLWKPKEPLPAKDEAGKKAGDILLGKLAGPEKHNLNAIATQLDSFGNLKTLFSNKDVQRNEVTEDAQRNDEVKLVDVIVQLYTPSRKRHSTEDKPEDPKRPKIGTGGSPKLVSGDRPRTASDESNHSSSSRRSAGSQNHSVISPEAHRKLDERIPPALGSIFDDSGLFRHVLSESVDAYKNTKSPLIAAGAWSEAWEKHPHLRDVFLECKETWSFQKLREQHDLHIEVTEKQAVPLMLREQQAIVKAWEQKYVGGSHELLLNEIRKMNSECRPEGGEPYVYANNLPIIQSSGTGKSRMVDELAKLIFTIPFCIRHQNEESNIPYPRADKDIVKFLLKNSAASYQDVLMQYLIFFEQLFVRVKEVLELEQHFPKDGFADESHLARTWYRYLMAERASLYKTVIKRINQLSEIPDATDDEIVLQARNTVAKGSSLIEQLKRLTRRQTQDGNKDKDQTQLHLVLYFDEAHTLAQSTVQDGEKDRPRYDALLSALTYIRELTLFAITLSTNSNLHQPAASKNMSSSARLQEEEYNTLQAPYTELPFDCLLNGEPLIQAGECTLEDTCKLSFVSRFGRPLWATLYNNGDGGVRGNLVDFAMAKLTGFNKFDDNPQTDSDLSRARLAILSTRLLLDFNVTKEMACTTTVQMVASNMRIAYSVPEHREYLWSGYPSEPILAEAASRAMLRFRRPAATILASCVENGLIERGNRGELVMRLLLIEAFDAAAKKRKLGKGTTVTKPVSLFSFLKALLGAKKLEEIKKQVPENTTLSGKTFEDAFKDAHVHFTHFVRNEDMSVSNSYGAWAALARGMAMQCAPNQDVIDCIIPVLLNSKDKLCENAVTGLLIQCKNKRSDSAVTIKEEKMNGGRGFFPRDSKDDRPYIGLLMQLGSRSEVKSDSCVEPRINLQRATKKNAQHPRYFINIKGCSPDQYPTITAEASNSYAALLGGRTLYSEHARQTSMKSVQRLKPMWTTRREDTYSWLKDPKFEEVIKQDLQIGPD